MPTGNELKRLRDSARMSRERLAALLGVPATRLTKWEQRDSDPKAADAQKVLAFFGISSLSDLVGLIDMPVLKSNEEELATAQSSPKLANSAQCNGANADEPAQLNDWRDKYYALLEKDHAALHEAHGAVMQIAATKADTASLHALKETVETDHAILLGTHEWLLKHLSRLTSRTVADLRADLGIASADQLRKKKRTRADADK